MAMNDEQKKLGHLSLEGRVTKFLDLNNPVFLVLDLRSQRNYFCCVI